MSLQNEKHLLINQLQIKPLDFIEHLKSLHDEAILKFMTQIFLEGELTIFEDIIFYLGKEHNTEDSLYSRILRILLQYQDDIYFYVLDNLVPPILAYHLSIYNLRFHINILHLSNYEPLLVKAIHYIEKSDMLDNLILLLQDTHQIFQPLRYTIQKYDPDLAKHLDKEISLDLAPENDQQKIQKLTQKINNLNQDARNERLEHNNFNQQESLNETAIEVNNLLPTQESNLENWLEYLENHNNSTVVKDKSQATLGRSETEGDNNQGKPAKPSNLPNHHLEVVDNQDNLLKTKNEEIGELDNISQKLVDTTYNLIYNTPDNISKFPQHNDLTTQTEITNNYLTKDLEGLKSNAEEIEINTTSQVISPTTNEVNNKETNEVIEEIRANERIGERQEGYKGLNKHLIQKVKEESILNNQKPPDVKTFEEFEEHIPKEKMDLLASFVRIVDNDAYLLLARNKTHLKRELNPSCQKVHKLINKPMVVSNKLGTNYKLENLSALSKKIRGKNNKPILYFDAQEALLCLPKNKCKNNISICNHQNVYQEYFYPYEKYKFGMNKQMYNLDVWLLLFQNINYYDNLEDTKMGNLLDLFEVVVILPANHYQNIVAGYQKGSLNLFTKNKFHFISAEDKLTPNILTFYLYSKFYMEGDMLLSPADFSYLQHGEGISINREYKFLEEYLPFVVSDMEMMKEILGQFYPNFNFVTEKIKLDSIKKKKYSKKKSPKLRKKKVKGDKSKRGKSKEAKVKKPRKYSRKQ